MELKEGMIIECRNGERYLLRTACGELVASSNNEYISLDYDEKLNENKYFYKDFDVMKIYTSKSFILNNLFNDNYLECIWERKEPKKMTLEQISKELGYEVEVIDNVSDYKFNVGDKVKVESLDFWSSEPMKSDIGKIGTVVFKEKDENKKCNAYLIQYDGENYLNEHDGWWFAEDSLNFIEE